mmetsp:Transcript_23023/g.26480  ORF Transcript_23023/g.26480 Transcript_23023/m.26480 type:complete len:107 (+) Transcript_23023:258-578(+)
MEPAAPDAAKNICINSTPNAVPLAERLEKKEGKVVAPATVRMDVSGREDFPAGSRILVSTPPTWTSVDATARDVPKEDSVIPELAVLLVDDADSGSAGRSILSFLD